jgi:beta-glucanase (GH16 family)
MLGDGFPQIDWPLCGEIDITEHVGYDPDTVYFSRHWGNPYVHRGADYSGPIFSQGFHTFAIHWAAEHVAWYVDGFLRYFTSTADAGEIFQRPFYLILNTAVGGYWPGYPNQSSVFPQYHEIDYVRWYVESDPGDFDRDGDVDTADMDAFVGCFSGDGVPWNDPACRFFDHDADDDVDCEDWWRFRAVWSGPPPGAPVFSSCGLPAPRRVGGRLP